MTPSGGRGSGCDTMHWHTVGRRTPKDLDAPEWAATTVGAEREGAGQEIEERVVVRVGLRLRGDGRPLRLTERITAASEQSLAAAVGEEPIVTDAHEAFREHME